MRVLTRDDVAGLLAGREFEVLSAVQDAYLTHQRGETDLPFSTFLRPPGTGAGGDRIIALPAYLGGPHPVAGVKWISSYPANLDSGRQRASAVMVLNDLGTGYPQVLLEASRISAWRTAASAALASHVLHAGAPVVRAALVGAGTINARVAGFLPVVHPELRTVLVHDRFPERAVELARRLGAADPRTAYRAASLAEALDSPTVSVATTDSTYWLDLDDHPAPPRRVVLHLSLRDLSVRSITAARNVVDDADHVCRERTSLHLAELQVGHRGFVDTTLGDLVADAGTRPLPGTTVFSPFGLGILDLAVADVVVRAARATGTGRDLDGFEPGDHAVARPTDPTTHEEAHRA